MGRDKVKRENRLYVGQDKMEGNIVSLTQHEYYGSLLQYYIYIAYIELLAFSVGMGGEERRERK